MSDTALRVGDVRVMCTRKNEDPSDMHWPVFRDDCSVAGHFEKLKDAKLFAAAPDLLFALKELIEGVAILTPDAPTPVPGSIISNAIAAVAKAEGKRHD